jgi:hypothetical protein
LVWEQHLRYFKEKEEKDRDPRQALVHDNLYTDATNWKEEGYHLIITGNFNKDVQLGDTLDFFTAFGIMHEVILEKHQD